MCLGLEFMPQIVFKCSGQPHSDLSSRQGWERGGVQLGRGRPRSPDSRPVFFPGTSFHWVVAHKEVEIVRPLVLPPPFSGPAFRKGRRGTQEVCSGSRSSGEAQMSSSRVSSLLQSTFSTEKMGSVCEDVTSLEEMQLH